MTNITQDPVAYMERTRKYYRALGYDQDYVWSHYDDVPFAPLGKALSHCRIGFVATASPAAGPNFNDKGRKDVWSGPTSPAPDELFTMNVAWDKESTHTRDRESFLPIETVGALAQEGLVGGIAERFHGVPTEYSQSKTIQRDAPEIVKRLKEDGAEAVVLTPL
ncbi:MAG: hypothetical protein AAF346_03910 [Pseudomonadota bacterium]